MTGRLPDGEGRRLSWTRQLPTLGDETEGREKGGDKSQRRDFFKKRGEIGGLS